MVLRSMSLPQCNATHANLGHRDFAQMRVRILLNAMGEARSWVLRAPKRSWRPICRAPSVRKKLSFKARERSVNVSHSWGGVRSDRAGILMEDFTFKVNLVAVVPLVRGTRALHARPFLRSLEHPASLKSDWPMRTMLRRAGTQR